jgi:excisionase family DNA binding protein
MKSCDQLSLPFSAVPEIATTENQSNHTPGPQMGHPSGNALPPSGCELRPAVRPAHRRQPGKQTSPKKANISPDAKLLVGREEAAEILSLSVRSIDYLLASKELPFRKIGTRTMIPSSALQSFARTNHPERIAS